MPYTDRYYQRDAREAVRWSWEGVTSNILQLGTGAGKTSVAARVFGDGETAKCLFLADQDELCAQPLKAFHKVEGIIAAVEKADSRASLNARVVVASAQTLMRKGRLERFPKNHFGRIIIDEAHRGARRDKEICDYFETATRNGMTATPFLSGMRDLSEFYEEVAYAKPMLDLIGEGFAPTMRVLSLPVEVDLGACKTGMTPEGKDYKPKDTAAAIEPYMDAVAELIKTHAKGRFGIAYLPLIETSKAFADCLRRHGITARHIDGGSKDRDRILAEFERGDFQWLCNAGVVSIGVDIPRADCMLNLAPIHSSALYQQRCGRPARVLPGVIDDLPEQAQAEERKERIAWSDKPDFLIFDLLWNHDKLGVMGPASLVAETEEEAAAITQYARKLKSPEDLAAVKAAVRREKEAALVNALEQAATRADMRRPVAWADAAVLIGDSKLIAYEATQRWELRKPEEFQMRILAKKGVNVATVKNKGQAVALLRELDKRYKAKLATLKQVRTLFRINSKRAPGDKIPNPGAIGFDEASALIGAAFAGEKITRLEEEFRDAA